MRLFTLFLLAFATVYAGESPIKTAPSAAITRQEVETRLNKLLEERDKTLAVLNAYDGAIQECKYWLSRALAAETEAAAKKAKPPEKK